MIEKLKTLRDARDAANYALGDAQATQDTATLTVDDWGDLTPDEQRSLTRDEQRSLTRDEQRSLTRDEQRSLISAVLERADVAPGRGAQRVAFTAKR